MWEAPQTRFVFSDNALVYYIVAFLLLSPTGGKHPHRLLIPIVPRRCARSRDFDALCLPPPLRRCTRFSFFPPPAVLQGMDRLLTMLMMFYFISPEDTNTNTAGPSPATTPVASAPPPSPLSPGSGDLEKRKAAAAASGGGGMVSPFDEGDGASGDRQTLSPKSSTAEPTPAAAAAAPAGDGQEGSENAPPQPPSTAASKKSPSDGSRTPPAAAALAAAPAEKVLLGERVYTVFSGLFEGFRLHDLYVPERGGVLVCTEVCTMPISTAGHNRCFLGDCFAAVVVQFVYGSLSLSLFSPSLCLSLFPPPPPTFPSSCDICFLISGFSLPSCSCCVAQVLTLLARYRLPELASHFDEIDFSVDMVSLFENSCRVAAVAGLIFCSSARVVVSVAKRHLL